VEPTTGYLVWRLSTKWRAAVDRAVKPLGLTHATFSLLGVLARLSGHGRRPSQRQLADETGLDPIYVSKLARALEKAGLVERPADPDDPRAVRLDLTAAGREAIAEAIGIVHELHRELTAPIGGSNGARDRQLRETLQALLGESKGEEMTTPPVINGRDINIAAAATRSVLKTLLATEGLTFEQHLVLRAAVNQGPATAAALAEAASGPLNAGGDPAALHETLEPLAAKGFIKPGDLIEATETGREVVARLAARSAATGNSLFDGFTAEELAITKRVLDRVTERASERGDAR
jgi:DNA-binding MarR family transcriptional regulator